MTIIAHASEYLTSSDPAFVHAVGFAARSGAAVRGIHAQRDFAAEPTPPDARGLLERWGSAPPPLDHAWQLSPASDDTAEALLALITATRPDLLIITTRTQSGPERLLLGSVAESVARNADSPVLVLPHAGPFLVSAQTGALTLERALVLGGPSGDAQRAADALRLCSQLAGATRCAVELLHVDDGTPAPQPLFPASFDVSQKHAPGPLERAVAERVAGFDPQLIVMASHGHDQLRDILFSSHTERVLHAQRRPLLWVPVPSGV